MVESCMTPDACLPADGMCGRRPHLATSARCSTKQMPSCTISPPACRGDVLACTSLLLVIISVVRPVPVIMCGQSTCQHAWSSAARMPRFPPCSKLQYCCSLGYGAEVQMHAGSGNQPGEAHWMPRYHSYLPAHEKHALRLLLPNRCA
jgi:hypothetical protein